jgi:NADH:ubiquinone oxidoreductase subunit 6 (subunit J)
MLVVVVRSLLKQPLELIAPDLTRSSLPSTTAPADNATQAIGEMVLTRFVLPFELLALLMLAAMLGAIYFARPEE